MSPQDEKTPYDPLTDGTDVPPDGEFSLEEILAEYGTSREQKILRDVEETVSREVSEPEQAPQAPPAEESGPAPEEAPEKAPAEPESTEKPEEEPQPRRARRGHGERHLPFRRAASAPQEPQTHEAPEPEKEEVPLEEALPRSPHPISLEEVVGSTVDAVMEEERREPLLRPRLGLFSRRKLEETERLAPPPEPEEEEEPPEPEPELPDAAEECRRAWRVRRSTVPAAFAMALVPVLTLAAEAYGVVIPWWSDGVANRAAALLGCLILSALLCRSVFSRAVHLLRRRRCTAEVLIALSALVSAGDCIAAVVSPERTAVTPYAAVTCTALAFAQWGLSRRSQGEYETLRTAALDDEPPYLVTETDKGACKQTGAVEGFYNTFKCDDMPTLWQTALLPIVAVGSLVFAGLSSLGQGRSADFLLNWSAILAAGATFALPLSWSLPFSRLGRHLQKAGCAVAGWQGAEKISARRGLIVTDTDLFPPGTMQLNGVKTYGEELPKVYGYAAAMARCAGCGLERLFGDLARSEGGRREEACDFSFYEEGGYSATIRGESVLMGTASFMRKMEVRLPGNINLKTGVFLAVDRQLAAVFAVKYNASENVDFALRMIRRSRMMPILAARDPNITPALLHRKFYKKVKVEYPDLSSRVALSEAEQDRGVPRALLFREGLLPYAEAVVGSRRMCTAARRGTGLSLLGSAVGTLLAFYMTSLGEYRLLTPLSLVAFLLLWVLPVLVMSDRVGRY